MALPRARAGGARAAEGGGRARGGRQARPGADARGGLGREERRSGGGGGGLRGGGVRRLHRAARRAQARARRLLAYARGAADARGPGGVRHRRGRARARVDPPRRGARGEARARAGAARGGRRAPDLSRGPAPRRLARAVTFPPPPGCHRRPPVSPESMPRRLSPLLLAALLVLLAPAAAHATWFPGEALDGPSADVVAVDDLDIARDGTGAVVWRRVLDGTPHVFVSRLAGGAWRPAERVDNGILEGAEEAAVGVADGGRVAVAWVSGSRVFGAFAPAGTGLQPFAGPTLVGDTPGAPSGGLDLDTGINGTAF